MEIAATLGSDIPFFLGAPAARATGRGECIAALPDPPALPLLLLKPSFGVATPDAYGRWADSKELPGIRYSPQLFPWGELVNDLERPVFWKHLFLAEMKAWLLGRPEVAGALMSGSGSTMFAVLREGADAAALIGAARVELDPTLWAWSGSLAG
jgi:4-diphosphocytidyl-2-C-methyl-D-erythritol kinase